MRTIRKLPPVCLIISLVKLLTGRLVFISRYLGRNIRNNESGVYRVFRHVALSKCKDEPENCIFVVSFKFSRLSFPANKLASVIPMLLITGFPGFRQKVYGVDKEKAYWQGLYQWRSLNDLEAYRKSFVYRMMNKRAIKSTVSSYTLPDTHLEDYMRNHFETEFSHKNQNTHY